MKTPSGIRIIESPNGRAETPMPNLASAARRARRFTDALASLTLRASGLGLLSAFGSRPSEFASRVAVRLSRGAGVGALVLMCLGLTGCLAPIGADRVTTRQAYAQVNAHALRTGQPSAAAGRAAG